MNYISIGNINRQTMDFYKQEILLPGLGVNADDYDEQVQNTHRWLLAGQPVFARPFCAIDVNLSQ